MKKTLSIIFATMIIFSLCIPANAAEINNDQLIREEFIYSDTFVDPALVGTSYPGEIALFDAYGERHIVAEKYTTYKTVYVAPINQPSLGYVGNSGATVFFFHNNGSSFNFSITVEAKIFTITADTGYTSETGGGYAAPVPSLNGRFRFEFIKYYTIVTKKCDVYGGGDAYLYSYYVHEPEYALSHRWIRLGN